MTYTPNKTLFSLLQVRLDARVSGGMDPMTSSWQRELTMRRMTANLLNKDYSAKEYASTKNGYMYELPTPRKIPQVGLSNSSSFTNGIGSSAKPDLLDSYKGSLVKEPYRTAKVVDYPGAHSNGYLNTPRRIYSIPNGLSGSYTKEVNASTNYPKDISGSKSYGLMERREVSDGRDLQDLRDLSIYATLPRGKARDTLAKAFLAGSAYANGIEPFRSTSSPSKLKAHHHHAAQSESHKRSVLPTSNVTREVFGTDTYYLTKMADVLERFSSGAMFTSSPSRITNYMYVGGYNDAENWTYLRRLGITHVLNMAGPKRSTMNPYPPDSGIVGYEMIDADDAEYYDVMQHFPRAKAFIDKAKYGRGKVGRSNHRHYRLILKGN